MTPEESEPQLRELWGQGLSFKKIGVLMGTSRSAIAGRCKRLGLRRGPSDVEAWPDDDVALLLNLQDAGRTQPQIARAMGRTFASVKSKLDRMKSGSPRRQSQSPIKRQRPSVADLVPIIPERNHSPVRLVDADFWACRYPLWDNSGYPDYLVCGQTKMRGSIFCAAHRAKCFKTDRAA